MSMTPTGMPASSWTGEVWPRLEVICGELRLFVKGLTIPLPGLD